VKCTEMITWVVRQAHKICTKLIPDFSEFFPKRVYYAERTRQLNCGRTKRGTRRKPLEFWLVRQDGPDQSGRLAARQSQRRL